MISNVNTCGVAVGDVVAVDSNNADKHGGTVVAVYGDQVVFQTDNGTFYSWSAETVWVVWKAATSVTVPTQPKTEIAANIESPTHDIKLGDVVAAKGAHSTSDDAYGGKVVAVVGSSLVTQYPSGKLESWDDVDQLVVLCRAETQASSTTPAVPIRTDQFADEHSVDVEGTRIRVGDRVEVLNEPEQGGVIIAVASDVVLLMMDWTVGNTLSHGVLYKNADEVRVLPDVHANLIQWFTARIPKDTANKVTAAGSTAAVG